MHLAQVVTQIGPVLDLEFPDGIQRIINALKPLAIDLQSILQLDCLAGSDFTFYAFWMVRCFLLPGLMLAAVGLQYVYERRRVDHATALGYFKANAFVVIFLCYVSLRDIPMQYRRAVLESTAVLECTLQYCTWHATDVTVLEFLGNCKLLLYHY